MPLKYRYTNKEEIPADQTALYVEREGAFYLDAEGVTDKAKADEMRNHNIELRKQLEEKNGLDGLRQQMRCDPWPQPQPQ